MSYASVYGGHEEHAVVDELLALLGQNWRLLLLCPGGLSTLGATSIVGFLFHGREWWRGIRFTSATDIVIAAGWLVLIALLPLPQTGWPYGLDLLTLILLIELPYMASIGRGRQIALPRAAAMLNVYPLLALAIAALGQATGSLVIREVNRSTGLLHWVGVVAWAITLPPLLDLGPWRSLDRPRIIHVLRGTAHVALLMALALPAHDATPQIHSFFAFMAIVLPLAALHRWWHGNNQWWIRWQPWLVTALALLLAMLSGQQLLERLR